jgi:hypothetical protein
MAEPAPLLLKQPPEPIEEMPAEQKPDGANVQWIPGYWAWDDERSGFLWVSGFWRVPPPDRQWLPGRWNQEGNGWRWAPGYWAEAGQQEVAFLPRPPAPVDAVAPPQPPGENTVFVPGTWIYRTPRYLWRPGFWTPHRAGWVWIPARYVWTPAGFVFVDGHWDFPLRERGLLFAPVAIDFRIARRPLWVYRPSFVVSDEGLLGALFVRPGWGYFFGDYFDARYRRQGFTAWVDYRIGGVGYDPLFGYYRWTFRRDVGWERGLRDLYVARFNGDMPRPPRTFVQQTVIAASNRSSVRPAPLVTPLAQVDRTAARLQPVSPQQLVVEHKNAKQFETLTNQRARLEVQGTVANPSPSTKTGSPRTVRLDFPRMPAAPSVGGGRTPPPAPIHPNFRDPGNSKGTPVNKPDSRKQSSTGPLNSRSPVAQGGAGHEPARPSRAL